MPAHAEVDTYSFGYLIRARIAQLIKKPGFAIYRSQVRLLLLAGMFFWYGPSASFSLIVASEHHGQNNGCPNQ